MSEIQKSGGLLFVDAAQHSAGNHCVARLSELMTEKATTPASDGDARLEALVEGVRASVAKSANRTIEDLADSAEAAISDEARPFVDKTRSDAAVLGVISRWLMPDETPVGRGKARLTMEDRHIEVGQLARAAAIATFEALVAVDRGQRRCTVAALPTLVEGRLRRDRFLRASGAKGGEIGVTLDKTSACLAALIRRRDDAEDFPIFYRDRWARVGVFEDEIVSTPTVPAVLLPYCDEDVSDCGVKVVDGELVAQGEIEVVPLGGSLEVYRADNVLTLRSPVHKEFSLAFHLNEPKDPALHPYSLRFRLDDIWDFGSTRASFRLTSGGVVIEWDVPEDGSFNPGLSAVSEVGSVDDPVHGKRIAVYVDTESIHG